MTLLILLQLACAPPSSTGEFGNGPGSGGAHDSGDAPEAQGDDPWIDRSGPVRGLWAPMIVTAGAQSMDDPVRLAAGGFDTVAVPQSLVMRDGEVVHITPISEVRQAVRRFQDRGFQTMVSLDVIELNHSGGPGVPMLPTDPATLDMLLVELAALAALAEAEEVELFGALNEPDIRLGGAAGAFAARQLAVARRHYSGPVMWKGGGNTAIPVDGYDVVGTSIGPHADADEERIRNDVRHAIDALRDQAEASGVESIMVTEFGLWGGDFTAWPDERKRAVYDEVVTHAPDLDGYFVFDGPEGHDLPLAGSVGEQVTTRFFLSGP